MNNIIKSTLSLALCCAAFTLTSQAASVDYTQAYTYEFAPHSTLAQGKWVRISISDNGVYEISYEKLREMGFSDPSKVAVYGLPGYQPEHTFTDARGIAQVENDIKPVSVLHSNNKLLFYGRGVAKMQFSQVTKDSQVVYRHTRVSRSAWADHASYFLTDSKPMLKVQNAAATQHASAVDAPEVYAYKYHEVESHQGLHNSGPLFWGEEIAPKKPVEFSFSAPYCVEDVRAGVLSEIAVTEERHSGVITVNFNGKETLSSLGEKSARIWTFDQSTPSTLMNVDENHIGTCNLKFSISDSYPRAVGIDYWTVTYPVSLQHASADDNFSQIHVSLGKSTSASKLRRHILPAGSQAWEITNFEEPVILDSDSEYFYIDGTGTHETIVFNPEREQLQIEPEYEQIVNQDLHSEINNNIDLVIFTTPQFKNQAERLADLHRNLEGIGVLVVTPQQVFNEFTSGTPNPIAYRMLAKLLYHNTDHRLKNVLLFGPIHADYRNVRGIRNRLEGHPVFSQLPSSLQTVPTSILDYYGCVGDRVLNTSNFENARVRVGVGVLPVTNAAQADRVVENIKEYLSCRDFSNIANEYMSVTCEGDSHIHDNQGTRFYHQICELHDSTLNSDHSHKTVWTQATGSTVQSNQFIDGLREGKILTSYYGHANNYSFGGNNVHVITNLDLREPGFLFLAGCDLTIIDQGVNGVGDMAILEGRRPFAGVIASTRQVMSNFNEDLFRKFVNGMFYTLDNEWRIESPTVGEVFAVAKDRTSNESEIAYYLIGDPALRMYNPLTPLTVSASTDKVRKGDVITVTGEIRDTEGNKLQHYNGTLTAKLLAPKRTLSLAPADTLLDTLNFTNLRLATVQGNVVNGQYTAQIVVPADAHKHLFNNDVSSNCRILVTAFDPDMQLAASGATEIMLTDEEPQEGETPSPKDTTAPVITAVYDPDLMALNISANDDYGFIPGIGSGTGIVLTIDDTQQTLMANTSQGIATTAWNGTLSVATIGEGEHIAKCTVTDLAGNKSASSRVKFTVTHREPLQLTADSSVAVDELTLSIPEDTGFEMEALLVAADGTVALRRKFTGHSITLDLDGIAAGHYRAAVRQNSARGANLNSNWLEITVID